MSVVKGVLATDDVFETRGARRLAPHRLIQFAIYLDDIPNMVSRVAGDFAFRTGEIPSSADASRNELKINASHNVAVIARVWVDLLIIEGI